MQRLLDIGDQPRGNRSEGAVQHCCDDMQEQVDSSCTQCDSRFDCPDCLIHYLPRFREYGIMVHDGGTSFVTISFCPWCGHELPTSERERWFCELEARGIDPWSHDVPDEFLDERWLSSSERRGGGEA